LGSVSINGMLTRVGIPFIEMLPIFFMWSEQVFMLTKTLGNQLPWVFHLLRCPSLFFIRRKQVFICSVDPLAMGFTRIRPKFGSTLQWPIILKILRHRVLPYT
jgi:hypothetical protein